MGLFGIFKGAAKTIEGIVEGDAEKIVKGVGKTITGVVTTVTGSGNDDDDDE